MVTEIWLFESPDVTSLHFCFGGILDGGARIKKRKEQLRRTTRNIHTVAVNLMVGFSNIYFKL